MKQKIKTIRISDLRIIESIITEFEKFNQNLENLLSKKHPKNILKHLDKLSKGELLVCDYQAKKFYEENEFVLSTIAFYSGISNFIIRNYDWKGKLRHDYHDLEYFYNIIKNNENKLRIIQNISKLQKLGFKEIHFDENMDLSKEEYQRIYSVDKRYYNNKEDIIFLDNMEAIPNCDKSIVKYTSFDSDYIISIPAGCTGCDKSITLNSLDFSSNLPDSLSKEDTFDKIIALKDNKVLECEALKNIVDISLGIDRIYDEITKLIELSKKLDDEESIKKINHHLLVMYDHLKQLTSAGKEYYLKTNHSIPIITKELIDCEKEELTSIKNRKLDRKEVPCIARPLPISGVNNKENASIKRKLIKD